MAGYFGQEMGATGIGHLHQVGLKNKIAGGVVRAAVLQRSHLIRRSRDGSLQNTLVQSPWKSRNTTTPSLWRFPIRTEVVVGDLLMVLTIGQPERCRLVR